MAAASGDSSTATPAVVGTNTVAGHEVRGLSTAAEGVHGETSSPIVAAVARINVGTVTGTGVYGENDAGIAPASPGSRPQRMRLQSNECKTRRQTDQASHDRRLAETSASHFPYRDRRCPSFIHLSYLPGGS